MRFQGTSSDRPTPLDAVVIGSSAGGVKALLTVIPGLPVGMPAAVLVGAVTRRLVNAARCPLMVVPRTRDATLGVALIGGMEAAVDA